MVEAECSCLTVLFVVLITIKDMTYLLNYEGPLLRCDKTPTELISPAFKIYILDTSIPCNSDKYNLGSEKKHTRLTGTYNIFARTDEMLFAFISLNEAITEIN